MHKDMVTVVIIKDHDIVVAGAGHCDKFSSLVCVNLTGGSKDGNETLMSFGFIAEWERIGLCVIDGG
jgi:hypothetical protein